MRYDYRVCNDFIAENDIQGLWLYIQNEGNLVLRSRAERFMVFYKVFRRWIKKGLTGNFVAYYLNALSFYARSDSLFPSARKVGIQDPRTSGMRAEKQQWNPQEAQYVPKTMVEDLLLRFDCV